ncbi:MAG: ribbon-helix-helix domain-containing protein [Oscillospiraceae bacterium]|nr:ribbon-helix-helix domain-containing protein [Oscillospiraceae bacterium]
MDSENKQRISLYLDKSLIKKADKILREHGYKSRNEFYTKATENFIADEILHENKSIIGEKLATAVVELSEENAKAISKGLFRYAVQLEMVMRMIAEQFDYKLDEIEDMRREAVNNVRRTRGKVHLEEILQGYYDQD